MGRDDRDALDRENQRLLAQASRFADGESGRVEAERWQGRTPEERLAETWRLCGMVPWYRKHWPPEVRKRAHRAAPPPEVIALLERMRRHGGQGGAGR
jgi:hypothetical protein